MSATNTESVISGYAGQNWRFELRDFAPLISLLVLAGFFATVTDSFLSAGTLTLVLQQGAVLAIVAAGLTFVLLCGEIDLSVGMVALWTACLCGVLHEQPLAAGTGDESAVSTPMLAFVIVAPCVSSMFLGLVSGRLTVWARMPSFIITLAMMNIAYGLARYTTKSEKLNVPMFLEMMGNRKWMFDLGTTTVWIPYSAALAALVLIVGHLALQHTRFGRYVYMTGGNREAARLAGVRTDSIIVYCLILCALTAGIGGLVNAGRMASVSLDQNADLLLNAVACVVLGGTSLFGGEGGMGRTLIGVLTFSVLQVGLNQIRIDWLQDFDLLRPFVMGVVLMIALVINGRLALAASARSSAIRGLWSRFFHRRAS